MADIEKKVPEEDMTKESAISEQAIDAREEDFPVPSESRLSEKEEMMMELMTKFPQFAYMPPRSVVITSFLVFIIGIAGVIVGFAVPAFNLLTKFAVVGGSVLLVIIYSFIYKNMNKKRMREKNAYAYDFYDRIVADYKAGNMQNYLKNGLSDVLKEDIFTEMEFDEKTLRMWACGEMNNGRELTILFSNLSVEITIDDESRTDDAHFYLLDNERNIVDSDVKYGYARKQISELYDDIIEIVKFKMNLTNSEDDEEF